MSSYQEKFSLFHLFFPDKDSLGDLSYAAIKPQYDLIKQLSAEHCFIAGLFFREYQGCFLAQKVFCDYQMLGFETRGDVNHDVNQVDDFEAKMEALHGYQKRYSREGSFFCKEEGHYKNFKSK